MRLSGTLTAVLPSWHLTGQVFGQYMEMADSLKPVIGPWSCDDFRAHLLPHLSRGPLKNQASRAGRSALTIQQPHIHTILIITT